ncbi:MAG: thiolase family protein [Acidimicrobiia bacterium]
MGLVIEAVKGALADAGLELADVDGMAVDWHGPGGIPGDTNSWSAVLPRDLAWTSDGAFGNAGSRGVALAAPAIEAGLCETAVVGGGVRSRSPIVAGETEGMHVRDSSAVTPGDALEFSSIWGAYVIPMFALPAQRHMYEFGTRPEQLAHVAATIRNHGDVNPEAMMFGRGPYTIDDVLDSPMIASPLHLLDCCLVGEGGAAVVLTTAERADDLVRRPVRVLGAGMQVHQPAYAYPPTLRGVGMLGSEAARRAFGRAGVAPRDVDVFSLYDPTSFEIIRQFEAFGLCAQGEGGEFVAGDTLLVGGSAPTNLDGGCLSYAWNGTQQMTLKVIDCVRQLRRDANQQVRDAELAVSSGAGSGASHFEKLVLGRA